MNGGINWLNTYFKIHANIQTSTINTSAEAVLPAHH
jgi:hypothetical protein